MNNAKFATALHILTLLDLAKGQRLSSEWIAGSINLNPALVRKEISNLRKLGFISSKEGNGGGCTLARPSAEIFLSEIYKAVRMPPLLGSSNTPNPSCMVGRQINQHLEGLYTEAELSLTSKLEKRTLKEFGEKFQPAL
ncbi:DNA-binding IscR family transcriptional regulator [Pedobacter cryoconitis]|uniref:DNA-binding IscR family transcriptional regulator n=1 Tax=Pedobacter cryoconitis TaxID=188932 RepID=A0A7W9DM72_9SPHI|nr:Rrf2 family transcriptional regulator [Pedobacter cryoconitis]MBB5623634.1 DNA-binding IscR family transcriptional regulator [Pedobacter cryoconitis]MBB5646183.1 DNA-binding IscR family transcriptional regulator [Pedobacter cryoconitis]